MTSHNPLVDDSNQRLLQLFADGATPDQAAREMAIARQTVFSRLHRLRTKLGAKTTTHLVAIALRGRLIR